MLYLGIPNTVCARRGGGAGARNSRDRRHYSQAQSRAGRDFTVSELRHQGFDAVLIAVARIAAAISPFRALIWMAFTRASTFSLT